jgi:hypothetical protein
LANEKSKKGVLFKATYLFSLSNDFNSWVTPDKYPSAAYLNPKTSKDSSEHISEELTDLNSNRVVECVPSSYTEPEYLNDPYLLINNLRQLDSIEKICIPYERVYPDPVNQRKTIRKENINIPGVYAWVNKINGKVYIRICYC